jgi:1,4-alpha-glucan branching enzyme
MAQKVKKMTKGFLAIVLHAHLPFVRHLDYDDALEERWLFEALTECYLPLLAMFEKLIEDNIDFRLTLSVSPTLAAMFGDAFLQYRYLNRLESLIELGEKEVLRTRAQPGLHDLARFYHHRLLRTREAYVDRYGQNPLRGFQRLQELGKVEIIASAATHGYLPLLAMDQAAVLGQITIGIDQHLRDYDHSPAGFWLPECGYTPGIDTLLADRSIDYTIVETHGITGAEPRPEHGVYAPIRCPSGVAVFGRDPESSRQVWSATTGYPGDPDYREFYRDIAYDLDFDYLKPYLHVTGGRTDTGFKYHRITGPTERKALYDPDKAVRKAAQHAAQFVADKGGRIADLATRMDRPPILVAPYDAELFGHWWFEGPNWLDHLIRAIDQSDHRVRLTTLSEYLARHPASFTAIPNISSWGHNGFHETWLNEKNDWLYPHLHQAAIDMHQLAQKNIRADGLKRRALQQAARELLLAQSSDWAFILNAGTMSEYASHRARGHLLRFRRLKEEIEGNRINELRLVIDERQDNLFPRIDYKAFT